MTDRHVAVVASESLSGAAPPGVDPTDFALALLEDCYEIAAGLEYILPALVLPPHAPPGAAEIVWPGTTVVRAESEALPPVFHSLHALGATEAAVLVGDAPDLPPLLIGKLFRALGHAPAAASQAENGGLVALAVRLPLPAWLSDALNENETGLDTPDAFTRLRAAAPRSGMIQSTPGWHRLRTPADLARLDPGLEGWENTRALLSGDPLH